MSGTPMPYVKIQFLDDDGAPAAGYQLFTYDAGGAVKANTWTDKGLTSLNTNPIVLDSAGRATVYLQSKLYKFVLATPTAADPPAGGDQTWSMDNIASVPFYTTSTTIDTVGTEPEWTISDNTITITLPPGPVTLSSYYVNNATGTTAVDIPAGTMANNGDILVCEWEMDYASADLFARCTVFGVNYDLGCGAGDLAPGTTPATYARAKCVIIRGTNTSAEVTQTVLQNTGGGQAQVATAQTSAAGLDFDNNAYSVVLGMAAGTWTIRAARIYYVKTVSDLLG